MESNAYEVTYNNEKDYWWFSARSKIVNHLFKKYRRKYLPDYKLKILNVGCGTGILSESFSRYGTVYSMDYSSEALRFCTIRHLPLLTQADAVALPYRENSMDAALYLDIIEHIDDDEFAFKELYRMLSPGGLALITVPACQFLWSPFDDANWHKRRYNRKKLKRIIHDKFDIIMLSYYNFFLFPLAFVQRFYEKIFKRNKKEYKLPEVGRFTNKIFHFFFAIERFFLPYIRFPYGVSLICVVRKPDLKDKCKNSP